MKSRELESRMLAAAPTDLRVLVERYPFPMIVCDEEGCVRFCNASALTTFGEVEVVGRALPQEWMDREQVQFEDERGLQVYCLRWAEVTWEGNPAWYLVTFPTESAEANELQARLEQSIELVVAETEKRQQVEGDRERLEAKLRDLHQRSVAKLEAARGALEAEKTERQALLERLTLLKKETDDLKAELGEKSLRLEEVQHSSGEMFESLKLELVTKDVELRQAQEQSKRYQKVYQELDSQVTKSKEESALLSVKLYAAEARLDRAQRLLDGASIEAVTEVNRQTYEAKVRALNERIVELETKLRRQAADLTMPDGMVSSSVDLQAECERLREEVATLRQELLERSRTQQSQAALGQPQAFDPGTTIDKTSVMTPLEASVARATDDRTEALLSELRVYGQVELLEAREALAKLQDLYRGSKEALDAYYRGERSTEGPEQARSSAFLGEDEPAPATEAGVRIQELEEYVVELEFALESLREAGAPSELGNLRTEERVVELEDQVAELESALLAARSGAASTGSFAAPDAAHQILELEAKVMTLESELAQAREASSDAESAVSDGEEGDDARERALQDVFAPSAGDERVQELEAQVASLEAKLEVLREEASMAAARGVQEFDVSQYDTAKELERSRGKILELELLLAQSREQELKAGAGESENGSVRIAELEHELTVAQAKVGEVSAELRRVLDGDRETKKLAYSDQLTGLANYNLTAQYLQVCFERCSRGEGALALILIDIDHFRRVNDALGQKAGDELLRQIGARLQYVVVEKDTAIARRGEDEFIVVAFMEGTTAESQALAARVRGLAHNVLTELARPFEVWGQQVETTVSMGVTLYPGPAADGVTLVEQAEHAMYQAKEAGRGRVVFYTHDLHQARGIKHQIERDLHQAVTEGQFVVVYQPIIEIPTAKVVGIEALLRWSHPQKGLLLPRDFLATAEESGLILAVSEQVLAEALLVVRQAYMKKRFLSLNLSHRQLVDSAFPSRFMKHLERAKVRPAEVMVEVSERALAVDPVRTCRTLSELSQWGVGIALDDFGSGPSDLSIFQDFAIRVVKIDGSLVGRLPSDRQAGKLCLAISRMAAALEIPVLAEGVESREQLAMVAGFGCRYAQGHFLGSPMNLHQLQQSL